MMACVDAGADVIDGATDSMSGTTSQPAMSALLASLMGRKDAPEVDIANVRAVDSYWAQLRVLYSGFDAKLSGPDPDVYLHEIPGMYGEEKPNSPCNSRNNMSKISNKFLIHRRSTD
jgi:pyruvate carboxylase